MSAVPNGYRIRPPTSDDVDAVAAVMQAADVSATGSSDFDADMIRDVWSSPGVELSKDAWVVSEADTVVAYAHLQPDGDTRLKGWGDVHPEHRGRGIGSALLDRVEARASERLRDIPEAALLCSVTDGDAGAAALVRARGFELVRAYRHMQIDLDGTIEPGEAPTGIDIRGIDPDRDLPSVHAIFVDAFRDEWGYRVIPFAEWRGTEVETPSYDPSLWFIAEADGEPVGAVSGVVWGDRGWVGELGVRRPWRGRGIASALLRRSIATFAERGLPRVMLNVDAENPTGAVHLYERVGMHVARGWDVYEKLLG